MLLALPSLILVVILAVIAACRLRERLLIGDESVEESWCAITRLLNERHAVAADLAQLVRASSTALEVHADAVVTTRSKALVACGMAEREMAEQALEDALAGLLAAVEHRHELQGAYPLKLLEARAVSLGYAIDRAKQLYNGSVHDRNCLIRSFPCKLVAGLFRLTPSAFFQG